MMPAVIDPQSPVTPIMRTVNVSEDIVIKKKICERDPFHLNSALQFSSSAVHAVIDNCTARACVSSTEENEHQI